jgi:GNAT superfamily N-acetyltransferase
MQAGLSVRVRSFTAPGTLSLPLSAALRRRGTVRDVSGALRIKPVVEAQLEVLLPMIAAYQDFYEEDPIRTERNRAFFRRFIAPSDEGMLIGAWREDELVGYACLYWHFSSTRAVETVLMNDLYVDKTVRGQGIGRALIEASATVARERGAHHLEWSTRPDNETARRLYDSTGAKHSTWIEYELGLQSTETTPAP